MIWHNLLYYRKLQVYCSAFTQNMSLTPEVVVIKKMAHHMKSPLATFNLNEEVALLEQTEKDANDLIMSNKIMEEFAFFKSKIVETIMALKEIKIV